MGNCPHPGLNCPARCSNSCPTPPGSARARGSLLLQVTTSPVPLVPVDAMEGCGRAQPRCQGPAAAEDPGVQVPPGPPGRRRAPTWLLSRARRSPGRGCSAQGLSRARSSSHRLEHKVSQIKAALKRRAWRQRQWLGGLHSMLSPPRAQVGSDPPASARHQHPMYPCLTATPLCPLHSTGHPKA